MKDVRPINNWGLVERGAGFHQVRGMTNREGSVASELGTNIVILYNGIQLKIAGLQALARVRSGITIRSSPTVDSPTP